MPIVITNLQQKIPIPVLNIKTTAQNAVRKLNLNIPELSIVFVGKDRMRRINREYLGHDYVTDVITFAYGEIIVCPSVAVANAKTYGNAVNKELTLYVVHGILHLAGYDDHVPEDILRMRKKEQELI